MGRAAADKKFFVTTVRVARREKGTLIRIYPPLGPDPSATSHRGRESAISRCCTRRVGMDRGECPKWKLVPPAPHSLATLARLGVNNVLYGFILSPLPYAYGTM